MVVGNFLIVRVGSVSGVTCRIDAQYWVAFVEKRVRCGRRGCGAEVGWVA